MEKCEVEAILGDEVHRDVELVEAVAAEIINKSHASELIRNLKQNRPINTLLGHLKRVKTAEGRLYILLDVKSDANTSQNVETDFNFDGLSNFSTVLVPKVKPVTRKQFEISRQHWPTQFHEDKRLEKILKKELFSSEEIDCITKYMRHALKETQTENQVGAVIVDPIKNDIVASASSSTSHPLQHAPMKCIDAVAATQGGGAWARPNQGGGSEICSYDNEVKKSGMEVGDHQELPPPAKRPKLSRQYLCTGLDVYITMEPCTMCAMGLLHSRVKRVFYSKQNAVSGALESCYKIHLYHKLNHHFEAFKVTM